MCRNAERGGRQHVGEGWTETECCWLAPGSIRLGFASWRDNTTAVTHRRLMQLKIVTVGVGAGRRSRRSWTLDYRSRSLSSKQQELDSGPVPQSLCYPVFPWGKKVEASDLLAPPWPKPLPAELLPQGSKTALGSQQTPTWPGGCRAGRPTTGTRQQVSFPQLDPAASPAHPNTTLLGCSL